MADLKQTIAELEQRLQASLVERDELVRQQAATAEVLAAINSSGFDLDRILQILVSTAARLCRTGPASIFLLEGDVYRFRTGQNVTEAFREHEKKTEIRAGRGLLVGRVAIEKGVVQIIDALEDVEYEDKEAASGNNFRSMLGVPLLRNGEPIGVFALARTHVEPFSESQIKLVSTFANQAVIAIENARLFDEVQAKTRDLMEALTYQTGSGNILRVIASSPTDVGPVLQAIVKSACELCGAYDALVRLKVGDGLQAGAHHGPIPASRDKWHINRNWTGGRAVIDQKPVHVRDVLSAEGDDFPETREIARHQGYRTSLSVPLLREGESIGVIVLRRLEVHPFSDKQIALLQTFADQAVIAIGNVRMFDEVQAKTRDLSEALQQQTATADVLKVISRSAFDLDAVLITLTESATTLCESVSGIIYRRVGDVYRYAASTMDVDSAYREYEQRTDIEVGRGTLIGRVALERRTVQIADAWNDPEYMEQDSARLGGGVRAMLGVPLIHQGDLIGAFALGRKDPIPFSQREVDLVTTFADQAVIAIQNVRLFDEVQARTKELAASLDDLRTAQGRLIQTEKLASLGQLTAGIAHEIKNPLNFVNNFSALSAELTDELNDVLKSAALGEKMRAEVDELTGLLKDNLEKVVQHGKRADSIVKNMLLHSREGSGEHRPADINSLLDESLNLAYHGARAEKGEFNITLQRDFDANAGTIELFPQEVTRAFLNLIANGVYAATRRKTEDKEPGFEPTLRATTKNLGTAVEIRIRDNGTGIPAEVQEKMFNPFFTTKPAGEGTGLGLSMTHDIIVKQHGGRIDVDTEPGMFTEFIITLPRGDTASDSKPE